jgi:hypothetical protein
MPRHVIAVSLAVALLSAACGDRDPAAALQGAPAPEPAPAQAAEPAPEAEPPPRPVRPAAGTFTAEYSDKRLSVAANHAPRLELLVRVAELADFDLVIDDTEAQWRPISALIRDESLADALPVLLGDFTFRTEQAFDEKTQTHRLVRVSVGVRRETAPEAIAEPSPRDPRLETSEWDHSEPLGELLRAAIREPREPAGPELLFWQLEDPDPEVRMRAALRIEPEGEGLDRLRHLLSSDPDPRVRAATTVSIENGEGYAAVKALVDALDDPDTEVLIEVIDSLAFAGDETNVADLERFLAHEDPRVREEAAEAIEFLE